MLKLFASLQVQEMVCLILLKNKCVDSDNESELFNTIIQLIDERKFIIKDLHNYHTLDLLFKTIDAQIVLDTKNFEKIVHQLGAILKTVILQINYWAKCAVRRASVKLIINRKLIGRCLFVRSVRSFRTFCFCLCEFAFGVHVCVSCTPNTFSHFAHSFSGCMPHRKSTGCGNDTIGEYNISCRCR